MLQVSKLTSCEIRNLSHTYEQPKLIIAHLHMDKFGINTKIRYLECVSTTTLYVSLQVSFSIKCHYNKHFYFFIFFFTAMCRPHFWMSHNYISYFSIRYILFCCEYIYHHKSFAHIYCLFDLPASGNILNTKSWAVNHSQKFDLFNLLCRKIKILTFCMVKGLNVSFMPLYERDLKF